MKYLIMIFGWSPFGCRYSCSDGASRRKNATRETTSTLKAWLQEHQKNPYPTKGEKIMLAIITRMTLTQVSLLVKCYRFKGIPDLLFLVYPQSISGIALKGLFYSLSLSPVHRCPVRVIPCPPLTCIPSPPSSLRCLHGLPMHAGG